MSNKLILKEIAHMVEAGADYDVFMWDSSKQYGYSYVNMPAAIRSWPAAVSATEVGYLDGVTSALQTQLDSKGGAYNGHVTGVGGTGDAITGTISPARTLAAGDRVSIKAGANNTGATTIALTGATPATAVAIQKKGAACSGGEIDQNGMYMLVYDGAVWQLVCGD